MKKMKEDFRPFHHMPPIPTKPTISEEVYRFLMAIDDEIENVSVEILQGRIEISADIKRLKDEN